MLLFLIGMPGAGKTFWGREIARNFDMNFTDLDKYITQKEKTSIDNIFKRAGEDGFRKKEHEYLEQLIAEAKQNTVVACGGGTPCYYDNIALLNRSGITVYIACNEERLLENMKYSLTIRPLLKDKDDVATFLTSLLAKRRPFYEQAQYILQAESTTLATFEQIIKSCTNQQ